MRFFEKFGALAHQGVKVSNAEDLIVTLAHWLLFQGAYAFFLLRVGETPFFKGKKKILT